MNIIREMSKIDLAIGRELCGKEWNNKWSTADNSMRYFVATSLQLDIEYAFLKSTDMDKTRRKVEEIIRREPDADEILKHINVEQAARSAEIRKDFAAALRQAKHGDELSGLLDYGFSDDDLLALAKLYKANRFRRIAISIQSRQRCRRITIPDGDCDWDEIVTARRLSGEILRAAFFVVNTKYSIFPF